MVSIVVFIVATFPVDIPPPIKASPLIITNPFNDDYGGVIHIHLKVVDLNRVFVRPFPLRVPRDIEPRNAHCNGPVVIG